MVDENPWTTFTRERFAITEDIAGSYLVVERPPAVMVLPLTQIDNIPVTYLVRQYRYPINSFVWQFPMGKLDDDESTSECAQRELAEETGLVAARVTDIGDFYVDPGLSRQKCIVYVAEEIVEGGKADLEETEHGLTTSRVRLSDFERPDRNRWISDSWGFIGAQMLVEYAGGLTKSSMREG